jgi:lipoprotein NlpD
MSRLHPLIAVLAISTLLAACAHTTVVRTPSRGKPPVSRQVSPPKPGSTAQVRKGDTLYRIATERGVSPLDLAMWNRIPPPYTIYPGQRLRLTAPDARPVYPPPRVVGAMPRPPATRPPVGTQTPPAVTPPKPPLPAPPPEAAFDWRWPADGSVV